MSPLKIKNHKLKIVLLAFGSILFAWGFSKNSYAQSALGISAIPPRLEITGQKGETVTKEIKVRNESALEQFITTTTKDFIVTDSLGTPIQLEYITEEENRWAASSWIQISPSQFKLKPGETKTLMLTAIIPDTASNGGHYAMVLHSPQNQIALDETASYIQTNVGSLVYITIPGPIYQNAKVKSFEAPKFLEYGPVNFKTIVTNLSDIHISPKGNINITNMLGLPVTSLKVEEGNIFPYASREFANTLNKKILFGRFKAQLNANYGSNDGLLTSTVIFWVIPWRLIILIIAIITLSGLLIRLSHQSHQSISSTAKIDELEQQLDELRKKYRDRK